MTVLTTRRDFIKQSIAGAGAMAAVPAWAESAPSAIDRVELGKTGIKVSRIAMGTGMHGYKRSSAQTRQGLENFKKLVRHGYESGLNFFDMADLYGSHTFVRHSMAGVPRENLVYMSKIWFRGGEGFEATLAAKPKVERFLQELNTDYLDICLIHCLGSANWPDELKELRDGMSELKEKGKVRAGGCSCHDFGALKVAADDPWVDVLLARINPKAFSMDVDKPEKVKDVADVLKKARANGKVVLGMKIFGEGRMTELADRVESMKFSWGNQLIDAMTIGFEKPEQITETIEQLTKVLRA